MGPSSAGKTYLARQIIQKRKELFSEPLDKVLYLYGSYQPLFSHMQAEDPNITFSDRLEDLENITEPTLVIIDDFMQEMSKGKQNEIVTKFYTKTAHHSNCSVISLLQNAFKSGLRDISINSHYLIYFDQRDRSSIDHIARQIAPGNSRFIRDAYIKAVEHREYGYLLIDLSPRNKKYKYFLRNNIFPTEDCEVYTS